MELLYQRFRLASASLRPEFRELPIRHTPKALTLRRPGSRSHRAIVWLLFASAFFLPVAGQQAGPEAPHLALDRTVVLPDSHPRRITLPALPAGAGIRVSLESQSPHAPEEIAPVQVEILRVSTRSEGQAGNLDQATLHTVLLARTPLDDDMVYRSRNGGRYLIALRRIGDRVDPVMARVRVELQFGASRIQTEEVTTLSTSARGAVAVFSAALLWTTLLLCGVPIVRAFRSRRNDVAPPWYG